MSAKQVTDTVLDGIAVQLGVGKRSKKTKTHHGNNLPSVTPNPREVRGQSQSLAKPVDEASSVSTNTDSHEVRPLTNAVSATGSTAATTRSEAMPTQVSELATLQSTVTELAGQMAWFVQRLTEDDVAIAVNEEVGEDLATDSPPVDLGSTETDSSETYPIPSGTLDDLQRFYGAAETVGADIDSQLADIVDTLLTSRLPEDKLKEKLSLRIRPGNCASLVATRVNPEIWDKLAPATRSRDVRSQRIQNDTIQGMIAVTEAANTLVRGTRAGETISPGVAWKTAPR